MKVIISLVMQFLILSPPACVASSVSTWASVRRPESCSSAPAGGHEDSRTASVCAGPSLLTWPARTNNSYGFVKVIWNTMKIPSLYHGTTTICTQLCKVSRSTLQKLFMPAGSPQHKSSRKSQRTQHIPLWHFLDSHIWK